MKTPVKILMLLLTMCVFACGQDDELMLNPKSLSGIWTYDEDESVVFDFYDSKVMRIGTDDYTYEISDNVLTLQYAGPLFIGLPPTEHQIQVTESFIWLDNLEEIRFLDLDVDEGVFNK